ncbi:MAG: hypothetical protein JXQ75_16040 [Phycisphaerae bacterium]|nr:hypothetical protein [Phycisphaerae bacterium]
MGDRQHRSSPHWHHAHELHRRDAGAAGSLVPSRRGVAIIGFVAALLIIGTLVLWLFQLTASTSTASLGHYYSTGAFYAAESGIEMAARELTQGGDGTITEKVLSTGAFQVEEWSTSPKVYRATGRPVETSAPWNTYRRVIEIQTQ